MTSNQPNVLSAKVVILGESAVGKTSIINRYINNSFNPECMTTPGASYASKTMFFEEYNKNIKFDLWDTAGQEKFRSLTKIFYKETSVAVLVYDITRKETFEEVQKYWYPQIKENSPKKTIIAIAANKGDLYEEEQVEESVGRNFAKEIGAIFRYTSAKNSSGIDELFKAIGGKLIDPNFQEGGKVEKDFEQEKNRGQSISLNKKNHTSNEKKESKCC